MFLTTTKGRTKMLSYTMTNNVITVMVDGKPHSVKKEQTNFKPLRDALIASDWDLVRERLTPAKSLVSVLGQGFEVGENNSLLYFGDKVPTEITERIEAIVKAGGDPNCLLNFWARLKKNPSNRSVNQLYGFLKHANIPITPEGKLLAYKSVRSDFKDAHSGTINNCPGSVVKMERNKISDDPNEACHYGLHVGALEYARNFSQKLLVVEVDPADVVSIPYDSSQQKMRVCEYKVVGIYGSKLSSTTYNPADGSFKYVEDDVTVEERIGDDTVRSGPSAGSWMKVPKKFKKIHEMTRDELLEQPLDLLRSYASNVLKIVGASRIPGGKISLIAKISNVRDE